MLFVAHGGSVRERRLRAVTNNHVKNAASVPRPTITSRTPPPRRTRFLDMSRRRFYLWAWVIQGVNVFIIACAAPPLATPTSSMPLPPIQFQASATPRRVPIVPPTRTATPTTTPAPTVPAVWIGFAQISVHDNYFSPDVITVTVGSRVRWNHTGNALHDISSEARDWGPGLILSQSQVEYTFTRTGTYLYICFLHRPGMRGTIVVVNP
jgi:plastocyanin